MPDLHGWTMTPWACVCGRQHAPWWRSVPPEERAKFAAAWQELNPVPAEESALDPDPQPVPDGFFEQLANVKVSEVEPAPAGPTIITDPEWLRGQYAAAVEACGIESVFDCGEIADAVLAVRDRHLEQLRQRLELADAELAQWAAAESADTVYTVVAEHDPEEES